MCIYNIFFLCVNLSVILTDVRFYFLCTIVFFLEEPTLTPC